MWRNFTVSSAKGSQLKPRNPGFFTLGLSVLVIRIFRLGCVKNTFAFYNRFPNQRRMTSLHLGAEALRARCCVFVGIVERALHPLVVSGEIRDQIEPLGNRASIAFDARF